MAKYRIERSCGHEEDVNIGGKVDNRKYKAAKESEKICYDCYLQNLKKLKEKNEEEGKKIAIEYHLCDLVGTPKQVVWATGLRGDAVKKLLALKSLVLSEPNSTVSINIIDNYIKTDKASIWIEDRDERYDLNWLNSKLKILKETS